MSFKPKEQARSTNTENRKYPHPKEGVRPGRISLIVDLGIQEQEDYEDEKTKEVVKRKPAQQIVYFADLTSDIVDYGGGIGEQPYRLGLFPTFLGKVKGTNFSVVPPKNKGGVWTYHPNSLHAKLARATNTVEIISEGKDNKDVSLLLGKPARFQVEVKKRESKYKDDEGKPVIFTDVKFKGVLSTEVPADPSDPDSEMIQMKVNDLQMEPMLITFDNVTEDMVKYLRKDVRNTIKQALNYEGSRMQEMIEKYESSFGDDSEEQESESENNGVSQENDVFDSNLEF